jgi:hypothetical protein
MKVELGYGGDSSEAKDSPKTKSASAAAKENYSMSVEAISNGWIVSESWDEGEGEKRKYHHVKTYHAENPIDK